MTINFDLSRLTSRTVRSEIGQRIIRGLENSTTANGNNSGTGSQIISFIFNGLGSIGGFLFEKISGLFAFSWTKFWGWFIATKQFLWNFNWNATDAQLEATIRTKWQALATSFGATLGNALGWIACGILPGAIIFAFNEPLGAFVLEQVTEEFLEEFLSSLGALFNQALQLGTQILITETFKNVRKLIKSNSSLVKKMFGAKAEKAVQAWGEKGSKPWSFAIANEEFLDKTFGEDGFWRDAAEEFQEEFDEACTEAGYVVANSIDTFLAQDMLSHRAAPPLGNTRYVEITPNRENPEERIVLGGREELLRPTIIQTIATYEQFNGRDLGTIYGSLLSEMPERRYRPEVVLKFYRKQNKNPNKGDITDALSMQIAFRLMNKSKEDFATDDYLKVLAETIHREMCTPPFKVMKGKQAYTYSDFEKGYQLKLAVKNEIEAKRIIKKVLDIQRHTFNDDAFGKGSSKIENSNSNNPKPDKVTIRGRPQKLSQQGKVGEVTFQYAYLNVGVGVSPINLVDLTRKKKDVVHVPTE